MRKISYVRRTLAALAVLAVALVAAPGRAMADDTFIKVATAQLNSGDVGNFTKMQTLATQAKQQGASLIIFPEGSVFGWLNPAVFTEAAPIPGQYSDQFANIAKTAGIWVAAGLAEKGPKAGPGSLPNAYEAYDSGVLFDPQGNLVIHHRKYNVLQNAFDPAACKAILGQDGCAYTPGPLSDIQVVKTAFGDKTAIMVCADAYTYAPATALETLKALKPNFVIVPWGITAGAQSQCGQDGYNATGYASEAADYLGTAFVVGSNATGPRTYGRFLPSFYCGASGWSTPTGKSTEIPDPMAELSIVSIKTSFDVNAGPIWNDQDAQGKCPSVCPPYSATWNGQWTTTVPGQMSVCGCVPNGIGGG